MPSPTSRTQTVVISILCLVAVGAIAFSVYGKNGSAKPSQGEVQASADTGDTNAPIATNGDWQKLFLEATTSSFKAPATTRAATTETLNSTDILGRQFLASYIQLKQAGLQNNSDAVNAVTSNLFTNGIPVAQKPQAFTSKDIVTVPSGATAARQYGNSVGAILSAYTPAGNDVQMAADGMKSGDYSFTTQLAANVVKYRTMLAKLKAVPVPQQVVQSHIDLMNAISGMMFAASALEQVQTDPTLAMSGLSAFNSVIPTAYSGMNGIKAYLASFGITYAANEGGSYFSNKKQ